jgi:hypothetical protein
VGEICTVEREYVRNPVDVHHGDYPRVMDLDAHYRMTHHEAALVLVNRWRLTRIVNTRSISRTRRLVSALVRPKLPFAAASLVLTFPSSTMFLGAQQNSSPPARSVRTACRIVLWCGSLRWSSRNRTFDSTR